MNTSGHQLTEDALGKSLACDVSQAGGPGEAVLLRPHLGDTASPGSSRGASGCEGLHSGLWGFGGSRDLIRMDSLHSALFLALPSSCPSCCLALAPAECELGVTLPPRPLLPHEAVSVPGPGAWVLWARRSGIPGEPRPSLESPAPCSLPRGLWLPLGYVISVPSAEIPCRYLFLHGTITAGPGNACWSSRPQGGSCVGRLHGPRSWSTTCQPCRSAGFPCRSHFLPCMGETPASDVV